MCCFSLFLDLRQAEYNILFVYKYRTNERKFLHESLDKTFDKINDKTSRDLSNAREERFLVINYNENLKS